MIVAAIFVQYSVSVELAFVTVSGNSAGDSGGAVYCSGASKISFVQTHFSNNTDPSDEDAVLFCSPFPAHSPCTVEGDMPDLSCDDPFDPTASLGDPATITVIVCGVVLLIGTVVMIGCVVKTIRARRSVPAGVEHKHFKEEDLFDRTIQSEDMSFSQDEYQ